MKRFLAYTPLVAILAMGAGVVTAPVPLTLAWDSQNNIDRFFLYSSPSLTNSMLTSSNTIAWTPYTNVAGNLNVVTVAADSTARYFILTASNIVGESFPSPSLLVPQVATNPMPKLSKP